MIFLVQFGINKHEKIFQRPLIARARRTFKVSCQDLANRKQNIFRMKTTFISTSWRKQCPIFTIFYKKILEVQIRSYLRQRFYSINIFAKHHTTWQTVVLTINSNAQAKGNFQDLRYEYETCKKPASALQHS